MLKWLAVGTVTFFAFLFLTGLAVIWYLSPVLRIDHDQGRVILLGGLIEASTDDLSAFRIGGIPMGDALKDGVEVRGAEEIGRGVQRLKIPFNTAKLEVAPDKERRLSWDCRSATADSRARLEISAGTATLNLDELNVARCLIRLPAGVETEFSGVNGSMEVLRPSSSMKIELNNGRVKIAPAPDRAYDFEVSVKNGLQDFFPRSNRSDAVKVKVKVVNGLVKKE